ncbi:MAG: peptidoglycan bridge formation glycyltransferase FemA/FemB family protein [Bacteroidota bacterium]|nr:peptidoglycan bridge formation glycyltransferase FemA/FemB family protein [Bacteroidota bacterium]
MLKAYPEKNARFFVARIQEKAVGASLLLGYKSYWENIYFATMQKFNPLYPSYLLNWNMIKYAMEQQAEIYSFGRSSFSSGTHQYKKQWGCQDLPLYWSHSHPPGKNIRSFGFLAELWRQLPYGLCKRIGPGLAERVY